MGAGNLTAAELRALERGRFSDGRQSYTVRASSAVAPDSFEVFVTGNPADLVLIVSGLCTGDLYGTWGEEWRTAPEEARNWVRAWAFHVFENGGEPQAPKPKPRVVRHCDG